MPKMHSTIRARSMNARTSENLERFFKVLIFFRSPSLREYFKLENFIYAFSLFFEYFLRTSRLSVGVSFSFSVLLELICYDPIFEFLMNKFCIFQRY